MKSKLSRRWCGISEKKKKERNYMSNKPKDKEAQGETAK